MAGDYVAYMGWGLSAQEEIDGFRKERNNLRDENARLREVVDIFIHCIGDLHSCYTCPVRGNPYDAQHDWGACDELRDMLVDMGFEVSE